MQALQAEATRSLRGRPASSSKGADDDDNADDENVQIKKSNIL